MQNATLEPDLRMGLKLAALRHESGLTQERLAELSGVARAHIQKIESGRVRPRSDTLQRLMDAMAKDPLTIYHNRQLWPEARAMYEMMQCLHDVNPCLGKALRDLLREIFRCISKQSSVRQQPVTQGRSGDHVKRSAAAG